MTDIDYIRSTFGLDPAMPATLTPVGRGALGEVARLEIGSTGYAVKTSLDDEPPSETLIAAEVGFIELAAAAGVRVATCYPATDGRYAVPASGGTGWIRLYDWLDGRHVDAGEPGLPEQLGALLGRLHRCAPPSDHEPDGTAPDPWFDVPPDPDLWSPLVTAARAADATWAADLAARLPVLREVSARTTPADPGSMVTCHRDLHPENVLAMPDGTLAVIDWEDLGPAVPDRELVRVVLDWFFAGAEGDGTGLDVDAVIGMLTAYRATGATGRITGDTFGFAIASRLNFLHRQIRIALDPVADERQRDWAVREIDEALRILPTPVALDRLVDLDAGLT